MGQELWSLFNRIFGVKPGQDAPVIYVELLNEPISVWRPVAATPEQEGVYRLPAEKPDDETWAFPPGSRVRVERRTLEDGSHLVACALAD